MERITIEWDVTEVTTYRRTFDLSDFTDEQRAALLLAAEGRGDRGVAELDPDTFLPRHELEAYAKYGYVDSRVINFVVVKS